MFDPLRKSQDVTGYQQFKKREPLSRREASQGVLQQHKQQKFNEIIQFHILIFNYRVIVNKFIR